MIPEPADRVLLRRRLMRRGQDLAMKLSELLAGKDAARLVASLGVDTVGARPEDILRRALDDNEQLRRWLDQADPRYGACAICGQDFTIDELREVPWADRCRAHAGTAVAAH